MITSSGGQIGNIEVQDFAALMRQDQEDVEHPEGGGWDDKEIPGDEVLGVGVEESLPGLVGASGSGAILANGRIRDLKVQLGQFGLDPFASPGGMARPHLPNE